MKRLLCVSIIVWLVATTSVHAQELRSLQPSRYSMQLTHILTRDGTMKTGWFIGTYGDTLVAQIAKRTERISRKDLVRVDVERPTERSAATLAGLLAGVYVGNALALKADTQPFLFMRDNEGGEIALYSALFGLVGGVLGNLVGGGSGNVAVFNFPVDEGGNSAAWDDFLESNSVGPHRGTVHLSFQGGWVSGPLPTSEKVGSSYYFGQYSGASSLNMVRKAQLTYSLNGALDVGLAFVWLGQPSISTYGPSYSNVMTVSLEGTGRYAIAVVQPLWKLGLKSLQWDIGGGVGVATYKCQASSPPYYFTYDSLWAGTSVDQNKTTFSTLLYTELKVFPSDFFSIGVAADWAYVPDRVPAVRGFTFDSERLGTTSIGFVLSFHI